jgi:hypothetical protein
MIDDLEVVEGVVHHGQARVQVLDLTPEAPFTPRQRG